MKLFWTIVSFLFGQILIAQTELQLRPYVGLQQSFSKTLAKNEEMPSVFKTNTIEIEADYGIGIRLVRNNKWGIETGIRLLNAGSNYEFSHKRNVSNYPTGSYTSLVLQATALEYWQLYSGYWYFIKLSKKTRNLTFFLGLNANIGLGIRANEDYNCCNIHYPGTNGDGNNFIIEDTIYNVNKLSVGIPLQLQFQSYLNKKPFFAITLFYNQGLTKNYNIDPIYILTNAKYISKLQVNGSVLAINLSYPITLWKRKNHISN